MKKICLVFIAVLFSVNAWAAGSCVQSMVDLPLLTPGAEAIKFVCTGDSSNGSIPNTDIDSTFYALIKGTYLYSVTAYPTSGGTAPDAADVTVTMDGLDLLGGKGVNLIHATATYSTAPYNALMVSYFFPLITSLPTVAVANEATASCNYTLILKFVR